MTNRKQLGLSAVVVLVSLAIGWLLGTTLPLVWQALIVPLALLLEVGIASLWVGKGRFWKFSSITPITLSPKARVRFTLAMLAVFFIALPSAANIFATLYVEAGM